MRYYNTHKGRINRMFSGMKERSLLFNRDMCDKIDFLGFMANNKQYEELFEKWVQSGYDALLVPTVDRIDNTRGYTLDNMQILTRSDNISKGNKETKTGVSHDKTSFKKTILKKEERVLVFSSRKEACDYLKVARNRINIEIKKQSIIKGWTIIQ